jgi:hypothetical protein
LDGDLGIYPSNTPLQKIRQISAADAHYIRNSYNKYVSPSNKRGNVREIHGKIEKENV